MSGPAPIEIDTPRLRLRQWRDADREPFFALCQDPRAMEFLLPIPDRAASDATIDRWAAHIAKNGWGFWAVESRETTVPETSPVFIGSVGLQVPRHPYPFMPCVEIGWRLAPQHWGKGCATEAARAALVFAFDRLALPEIVAITTIRNTRSQAVMNRLGMTREPKTFEHPAVPRGHPLREHRLYKLTAATWRGNLSKM